MKKILSFVVAGLILSSCTSLSHQPPDYNCKDIKEFGCPDTQIQKKIPPVISR